MKKMLLAAAIWLSLALSPVFAQGQSSCDSTEDLETFLREQYQEYVVAFGSMQNGMMMKTYANMRTGTWSILVVNGPVSCVVAVGQSYRAEEAY